MYNSVDKINKYLKKHFGDNLISLIIFGSYSKNSEFKVTSDLDYFIILKSLPKDQSYISREIKCGLKNQFPLVAFNIYSQKEYIKIINNNYWIVLSLVEGNTVIFDKNKYFQKSIEIANKTIKSKKVGRLSWYIENFKYPEKLLKHYRQISDDYLTSSKNIFESNQSHISLELLLKSIHTFMIGKLMTRNYYMTSGEITQLFFDVYDNIKIQKYLKTFLKLEQSVGQYYSFGFDDGVMAFNQSNTIDNQKLYKSCIEKFSIIKSCV